MASWDRQKVLAMVMDSDVLVERWTTRPTCDGNEFVVVRTAVDKRPSWQLLFTVAGSVAAPAALTTMAEAAMCERKHLREVVANQQIPDPNTTPA